MKGQAGGLSKVIHFSGDLNDYNVKKLCTESIHEEKADLDSMLYKQELIGSF